MASQKSKRSKKIPNKFKESAVQPKLSTSTKKTTKWFTVLCLEDNKKYCCMANNIETVDGLEVDEEAVQTGDIVIWTYRGTPYKAEILSIHDKKPMPGEKQLLQKKKPAQKRKYVEDSDDSESESELPLSSQKTHNDLPSDSDRSMGSTPVKSKSTAVTRKVSSSNTTPVKSKITSKITSVASRLSSSNTTPVKSKTTSVESRLSWLSGFNSAIASASSYEHHLLSSPEKEQSPTNLRERVLLLEDKIGKLDSIEAKLDTILEILKSSTRTSTSTGGHNASHEGGHRPPLKEKQDSGNDPKFISDAGVNLLTIRATDPNKYALALLEALFTDEELGKSCYAKTSRSTKPPLPAEKIALLEECVEHKFGKGTMKEYGNSILKKCNQKCLDRGNPNKRMKREQTMDLEGKEN